MPIPLASGVEVKVDGGVVRVKGPKGNLEQAIVPLTRIKVEGDQALVERETDQKRARAAHGLMRSLLANMVKGVTEGFEKGLEIIGVGYRSEVKGNEVRLTVGYSHPVSLPIPKGLEVVSENPTRLVVRGPDKQRVGQFAAEIRRVRRPEPYKGKGIRYVGEQVRRKVGKAGAATGA
jgi:large subunit ribosomal protein L6